jgi:hypothetical protein
MSADPIFGEMGSFVDDLAASPLFAWFALVRADEVRRQRTLEVTFRPEGPAFHDLAELRVSAAPNGRLESLELRLARGFVDDRRNGMFARDLAQSFLRGALDRRNVQSLAGLDDEIEWGGTFDVPVLVRAPSPARIPSGSPTPPYRVFLGRDERFERALHGVRLVLENIALPQLLRIGVTVSDGPVVG